MVSANDSGIDAGALQPYGLDKTLRVQELALENKLPYVQLVESAGANLLRYRVEDFIRGGNIFRNLARLSAAGLPVVTVTHGSSTAGGAYQTGLVRLHRDGARPHPRLPGRAAAAEGRDRRDRDRGGTRRRRDAHLDFRARRLSRRRRPRRAAHRARHHGQSGMGPAEAGAKRRSSRRATTPRNCSASCRWTTSGRSTCGRRSRASSTIPISPSSAPITAPRPSAAMPASRARRSASSPTTARSILPGANKATHFIQACCQSRTPLLYLNNTTGYMVGQGL